MSLSKKLKLWHAWWPWRTLLLVSHTVALRVVFRLTPKCSPGENSKESPETTQWLWQRSNQLVLALTYRAQILEQVNEKWPWSWTLTKIFTVTETLTAPQLLQERPFHTWVSEEELNQQVWEFTIAPRKFWQMPIKHQSSESAQDWRERHSSCKVSVMSDTGWQSSSSKKVQF